jgi:hypothetical protein
MPVRRSRGKNPVRRPVDPASPPDPTVLMYLASDLPDPACQLHQATANGCVRTAIARDFEHLLHTVAGFPPAAVSAEIRFLFEPLSRSVSAQERLKLVLRISGREPGAVAVLQSLIEEGPLQRFYGFRPVSPTDNLSMKPRVACDIVRCMELIEPLYGAEWNRFIPPRYLVIQALESARDNDYLMVDRVLGNVDERLLISIRIEPTDVAAERAEHTRYLARLDRSAHCRDDDDDLDEPLEEDWAARSTRRTLHRADPLADDILRHQRRYHETLNQPHLRFHLRVLAEDPVVAHSLASVVAGSAFGGGSYRVVTMDSSDPRFHAASQIDHTPWGQPLPIYQQDWQAQGVGLYEQLARLANQATVDELIGGFRLPVASFSSPACIRKSTDPPDEDPAQLVTAGCEPAPCHGGKSEAHAGIARGVPDVQLVKHGFMPGLSGTGKTTACINFLIQLAKHDIPFLVLETAKTEYRQLKRLTEHPDGAVRKMARGLRIYTVGVEGVSPFRHNPLEIPPGISRDEHIENLLECFRASMPLFGALPAILSESLERLYEAHPNPERPPLLRELFDQAVCVVREKGYSDVVTGDLLGALKVRIGMLTHLNPGRVFQCRGSTPSIAELTAGSSVIELDRLPREAKSVTALFVLTALRERLQTLPSPGVRPRLVVLVEEAHNLVGRNTNTSPQENTTDPRAHAAEFVCRMLAEVRAQGVGVILVDQLASAVAPEVVKSTAWKLAFRQVANDDRRELGSTMLFGPREMEEIARLRTGEAYFMTEGYHGPRRLETPNLPEILQRAGVPTNSELLGLIRNEQWFQDMAARRSRDELEQLETHLGELERLITRSEAYAASLVKQHPAIVACPASVRRRRELLGTLGKMARARRDMILAARDEFVRGPYRSFVGDRSETSAPDNGAARLRARLVRRFETGVSREIELCLCQLADVIKHCQRAQ